MNPNFEHGFEKTALAPIVGMGLRFLARGIPKILKGLTFSKRKFSPMRTIGTLAAADEVRNVAGKTGRQMNNYKNYNQLL